MKTVINNFQRNGSTSNSDVGRRFELLAQIYFRQTKGWTLERDFSVVLGAGKIKKARTFDLGSEAPAVLVECKCHRWTDTGKVPSAKLRDWSQAMYRFYLAPGRYCKILFVARDTIKNQTLAEYYLENYPDFIPDDVSIIEFDEQSNQACAVREVETNGRDH